MDDTGLTPPGRKKVSTLPPVVTRDVLDGRRVAAKAFDSLARQIHTDLGGTDQLSAIELALVEAFVGASMTLDALNAKLLLGEKVDLAQHAQMSSTMVKIASRLGLQRRARNITSLDDLLRQDIDRRSTLGGKCQPEQVEEQAP